MVWTWGGARVGKKGSYVGSHHEQENANQAAGERTGRLARARHGSSGRSLVPFWLDGWRESEGRNLGCEDASTGGGCGDRRESVRETSNRGKLCVCDGVRREGGGEKTNRSNRRMLTGGCRMEQGRMMMTIMG